MEEHDLVRRNVSLQRQWYGESLGDRLRRLVVAFDVSQAFLAEVLGLSAPMLSQVMSGRRAKIANPTVLAKMIMLERKCLIPEVAAGDKVALRAALADVRDAHPQVPQGAFTMSEEAALAVLRDLALDEELLAAAELLAADFPALADLLRRAAVE